MATYSCLENPTDSGTWQASYSPWGRKSRAQLRDEARSTHTSWKFRVQYNIFLKVILPSSFCFFKIVAARKFNCMCEAYIRASSSSASSFSVFYDADAADGN